MKQERKHIELLGFLSGGATTIAFLPQIFSTWSNRPKPATDISLLMYIIFEIGIIGWLIYGIKIKKAPIIVWDSITLISSASIIAYKIMFG